ncbi:MAG: hypothetical protein ABIU05_24300 [Nitrospirales bacterium]
MAINDALPETDEARKSLTVVFVNFKGERVDVDLHRPKQETRFGQF